MPYRTGKHERLQESDSLPCLLVLGCGNPFAGDDAVGLEIVRRLRESAMANIRLHELNQPVLDLSEIADPEQVVLVIDAVVSGNPPGTIHLTSLPCPELQPRSVVALSSHGWGLQESLAIQQALGQRLPRVFLLGIECGRIYANTALSAPVAWAVETVIEQFAVLRDLVMYGDTEKLPLRHCPPVADVEIATKLP